MQGERRAAEDAEPDRLAGAEPTAFEQAGSWLRHALELTERLGLHAVDMELRACAHRQARARFRVGVVGEPRRGKSLLINQILAADVLPTGRSLPAPVSVAPDAKERIEVVRATGQTEERPLDQASWAKLLESVGLGDRVRVHLDNQLLHAHDLEIVEIPGSDNGDQALTTVAYEVLAGCDAILMVVAATATPLGLHESRFLDTDLMGNHLPVVIVVLSKLDLVEAAERHQVLDVVRSRARNISERIEVLAGPGPDSRTADLDRLRELLTRLASSQQREQRRAGQFAGQLGDLVQELIRAGERGLEEARQAAGERMAAVATEEEQIARRLLDSGTVRVELEQRRLQVITRIEERCETERTALLDRLLASLAQAGDGKYWWERDLPWRWRDELTKLTTRWTQQLAHDAQADVSWLNKQLKAQFDAWQEERRLHSLPPALRDPHYGQLQLRSFDMHRTLVRLLPDATRAAWWAWQLWTAPRPDASAGSASANSPAAGHKRHLTSPPRSVTVATEALASLGDKLVDRLESGQREIIRNELDRITADQLESIAEALSSGLRAMYHAMLDDFQQAQLTWREAQLRAARQSLDEDDDERKWSDLVVQAAALHREITSRSALWRS